jgi:adenine deaminase
MKMDKLISVARGDSPADLVLANGRIVNTLNGEIEEAGVAVYGDRIAGVGDYHNAGETLDLKGRYLSPGFINGHTHLESSMLDVGQYARAVIPCGTSAIVTDLHEITNVAGLEGIRYVLQYARRLPFDLFLMAPSCVPATHLETSGAKIGPDDIRRILRFRECIGLGEMMNYPGVIFGDVGVLGVIEAAAGRVIDGHAPGVSGKDLSAYLAAGMRSDHESVTLEEAAEKLKRGMYIMIREGSSEKNLEALLPLVTDKTYKRCLFVVDDRSCGDLLHDGDIDAVVRKAVRLGLDPVRAIQLATVNAADYFRLNGLGAVAPGYYANLVVLNDLKELQVDEVFYRGRLVAQNGAPLFPLRKPAGKPLTHTVNIRSFTPESLKMKAVSEDLPVIEVVPGQIITRKIYEKLPVDNGIVQPDIRRDILKAVVVERHNATGNIGLGLVKGFGLKQGALASSTAHDSHNIVAVGTGDEDVFSAVKELERLQGGMVVVSGGRVVESLATPIAGLLSAEPLEKVVSGLQAVEKAAGDLGVTIPSPFAVLSFLALPVIPEIRLTDLGLVDVNEFKLIE